jgi:hypothetical protein
MGKTGLLLGCTAGPGSAKKFGYNTAIDIQGPIYANPNQAIDNIFKTTMGKRDPISTKPSGTHITPVIYFTHNSHCPVSF